MIRVMPAGFRHLWSSLLQDATILTRFHSLDETASFLAEGVSPAEARPTVEYLLYLRTDEGLTIAELNDILSKAGSPIYFADRDELVALLAEIEIALKNRKT